MLLCASDLHLGAGAGLGDRLADQERSWVTFCTKAAELQATVLWGGDSHHQRRPSPAEIAAWQSGLRILREADCELIGIPGNHCISSADAPSTVEVASAGFQCYIAREAQVIETADGPIGLLPWMPPRLSAKDTAEALMIVAADLAEQGARILIAHWAIAGGSLPNGLPLLELAEPMLDPYRLAEQFDLVLAGHIHKRQEIVDGVHHIGALSRASFGEAACDTGAWRLEGPGRGLIAGMPAGGSWFEVLDRRFLSFKWDLRGSSDPTAYALALMVEDASVEGAIVRADLQVTSDQTVDQAALVEALKFYGAHHVDRLQPLVERVVSTRSEGVDENLEPAQAFDAWLEPQRDTVGAETLERVRETAHDWIGASS